MRVPRPFSSASIASACLLFGAFGAADAAPRSASAPAVRQHLTVGYCTTGGKLSAEDSAAVAWVRRQEGVACRLVDAATVSLDRPGVDIVWIHVPDSVAWISWKPLEGRLRALGAFFRRGGKFLFTGLAAQIPFIAGIESVPPELRRENITDDWLFDQKGFQGFRGHPLFDGLYGGTFTWDTDADNTAYRVGYFDGRNPREGNVVGVEKSYVTLESDNRLMIEYGGGRGICIGAFVRFGCVNADRSRLELLLRNTLRYIAGERSGTPPTWWWKEIPRVRRFSVATRPLARSGALSLPPGSGLLIRRSSPCREFFDIAGRRTLLMGRENGGIDELWVQPFRVLRDFRCGLVDGDSIVQLAGLPVAIEIRPESLTRRYATRFGGLEEIVFPSLRRGGALVRYAWLEGARGCPLIITFRSDLRLMWPYDERAPGDLLWAYDAPLHALHVRDRGGDFTCVIGANVTPRTMLTGEYSGVTLRGGALRGDTTALLQVYHAAVFDMAGSAGRGLVLAVAGTDLGGKAALADYRALLADPASEYRRMADHYREMFARMLTLETPDTAFDARWRWALVGADRCIMETPRLGTALVAGFSTTERGWDGAQRVSGRPGYAWYFGRDAEWSGLALDACGGAETVRRELEFLQRHQDVTGKILHEMTASGVVHYDAADATPLYIVLAADYLRASGDLPFIRASWPHIERAMNFLLATDTDGDSLIENTNVGHGWVEGGKLWPPHTEFYLAGIWGQALQDAAWMADLAGKKEIAGRYERDAGVVKHEVDSAYWNTRTRFYNYAKLRDGSYNAEPTVLAAPVMSFGWLDGAKSLAVLRRYAGGAFSTDWGMRIVGDDSPLFNPRGYHEGSVWPLFTGWTALAAYAYGNSVQGFTLMAGTMEIESHWAAGMVQEVLDGSLYAPSGVCPHQCWSETAILHPGARGMLGWKPDATTMTASLAPRFPVSWDRVRARNLRIGGSALDLLFERRGGSVVYSLRLSSGAPVTIDLLPEVLPGATVTGVFVNGELRAGAANGAPGLPGGTVRLTLRESAIVAVEETGGIGVVPPVPAPSPGDSSGDFRFLGATLAGNDCTMDLEGKPGSSGEIGIRLFGRTVDSVSGGSIAGTDSRGVMTLRVPFAPSSARRTESHVVLHNRPSVR